MSPRRRRTRTLALAGLLALAGCAPAGPGAACHEQATSAFDQALIGARGELGTAERAMTLLVGHRAPGPYVSAVVDQSRERFAAQDDRAAAAVPVSPGCAALHRRVLGVFDRGRRALVDARVALAEGDRAAARRAAGELGAAGHAAAELREATRS